MRARTRVADGDGDQLAHAALQRARHAPGQRGAPVVSDQAEPAHACMEGSSFQGSLKPYPCMFLFGNGSLLWVRCSSLPHLIAVLSHWQVTLARVRTGLLHTT